MKKQTTNVEAIPSISTTQTNLPIVGTPVDANLLFSLRESGYNNYSAIADIVDNSLDVGVNTKNIYITNSETKITIADDGRGMRGEELVKALTLGSSTKDSKISLGKYGLGLKTGSSSIGRRVTVITKTKDSNYFVG